MPDNLNQIERPADCRHNNFRRRVCLKAGWRILSYNLYINTTFNQAVPFDFCPRIMPLSRDLDKAMAIPQFIVVQSFIAGIFILLNTRDAACLPAAPLSRPVIGIPVTFNITDNYNVPLSTATVVAGSSEPTLPLLFQDKTTGQDSQGFDSCVFTYGTLKKGEPNHYVMQQGIGNGTAKFVAPATTIEKYPLILLSQYNIPTLLYRPRSGSRIQGEIYLVTDKFRADLDDFEEHPAVYQRYPLRLQRHGGGHNYNVDSAEILNQVPLRCFVYMSFDYATQLLDQKTYDNYVNSNLPHALQYVTDEDIGADPTTLAQTKEATANPPGAAAGA